LVAPLLWRSGAFVRQEVTPRQLRQFLASNAQLLADAYDRSAANASVTLGTSDDDGLLQHLAEVDASVSVCHSLALAMELLEFVLSDIDANTSAPTVSHSAVLHSMLPLKLLPLLSGQISTFAGTSNFLLATSEQAPLVSRLHFRVVHCRAHALIVQKIRTPAALAKMNLQTLTPEALVSVLRPECGCGLL
jgi:hypothetical protein